MKYIHSEETLEIPEGGTVNFLRRLNSSPKRAKPNRQLPEKRWTNDRPRRRRSRSTETDMQISIPCEPSEKATVAAYFSRQQEPHSDATIWGSVSGDWRATAGTCWANTTYRVGASNADEVLSPQTVKVQIKARQITVEGPRGKLVKDLSHIAVSFSTPKKNVIAIHIHHGVRKNVAALRTVRTIINNLIIGVTKGFKYKMRYVYAHFPINVNLDKNSDGVYEVEIRYV